jgi:hypothetical protein
MRMSYSEKRLSKKIIMTWIQIISNKDKSDNIAEMYGVNQIPYTVLINGNGEIVGDNLRGKDLVEKIKSLLE